MPSKYNSATYFISFYYYSFLKYENCLFDLPHINTLTQLFKLMALKNIFSWKCIANFPNIFTESFTLLLVNLFFKMFEIWDTACMYPCMYIMIVKVMPNHLCFCYMYLFSLRYHLIFHFISHFPPVTTADVVVQCSSLLTAYIELLFCFKLSYLILHVSIL